MRSLLTRSVALAVLFLAFMAVPCLAQDATAPAADLLATAQPVVVRTVPECGAADVDPALTEIQVSFSKDMQDGNWSFVQIDADTFPKTTGKPHYLKDKRTCVLPVKLEPGKTYVLWINHATHSNFSDPAGTKALPYLIVFQTKK